MAVRQYWALGWPLSTAIHHSLAQQIQNDLLVVGECLGPGAGIVSRTSHAVHTVDECCSDAYHFVSVKGESVLKTGFAFFADGTIRLGQTPQSRARGTTMLVATARGSQGPKAGGWVNERHVLVKSRRTLARSQ